MRGTETMLLMNGHGISYRAKLEADAASIGEAGNGLDGESGDMPRKRQRGRVAIATIENIEARMYTVWSGSGP